MLFFSSNLFVLFVCLFKICFFCNFLFFFEFSKFFYQNRADIHTINNVDSDIMSALCNGYVQGHPYEGTKEGRKEERHPSLVVHKWSRGEFFRVERLIGGRKAK